MQRVMITGISAVSPSGGNISEMFHNLAQGAPGSGQIQQFARAGFPAALAAQARLAENEEEEHCRGDRKFVLLEKALTALLDNYPDISAYPAKAFYLGCGLDFFDLPGYVDSIDRHRGDWQAYSNNALQAARALARQYGLTGDTQVYVSACVAANHAIATGFRQLRHETDKLVICGGCDSMLNPLHYMGFYKLGAFSQWPGAPEKACRPFDQQRSGLVLGEGAALLALQNAEQAGTCLAEIAGYASSMDACSVTDPQPDGSRLAQAARLALADAGIGPAQIDCVHLHGTGTPKNDLAEAKAMEGVFGARYRDIPVFSLKGQSGHLIAACGALEMIAAVWSLQTQQVPVTVNFTTPDPEVPLRVVRDKPLAWPVRYVLKLNAAFGGQNTAFVIKSAEQFG